MRESTNTVMEVPDFMYMYSVRFNEGDPILVFVNRKNVYDAIETASNGSNNSGIGCEKVSCNFCGKYRLTVDDKGTIGYATVDENK
jgi:hypothetical protein